MTNVVKLNLIISQHRSVHCGVFVDFNVLVTPAPTHLVKRRFCFRIGFKSVQVSDNISLFLLNFIRYRMSSLGCDCSARDFKTENTSRDSF